jgi:hypothetical protein
VSRIRKALAPFGAFVALIVGHFTGAPADLVAMGASGPALLDALVTSERSRDVVLADMYALRRGQAYQTFGAAIGGVHQSAGVVMTYKPHLVGYLHGMALLVRAQRNLEEQNRNVLAALSDILLYGSTETQDAAKAVFLVLGEQLKKLGDTKQGSPHAQQVFDEISPVLGVAVVAWRCAAQDDLGITKP